MASKKSNNNNTKNNAKTTARPRAKTKNSSMANKLGDMNVDIDVPSFSLQEYIRVLKLARKPNREEFTMISKISILGITLIGVIGFIIYVFLTELPQAFG